MFIHFFLFHDNVYTISEVLINGYKGTLYYCDGIAIVPMSCTIDPSCGIISAWPRLETHFCHMLLMLRIHARNMAFVSILLVLNHKMLSQLRLKLNSTRLHKH